MKTSFTCTNEKCVNCNLEFVFEGEVKKAECGGCHKMLKGTPVPTPDVVVEAPSVSE